MTKEQSQRSEASELQGRLRQLPSVERLAAALEGVPHHLAVAAAREELAIRRVQVLNGQETEAQSASLRESVARRVVRLQRGGLRRVINATGVVLHTNLGRAPLAPSAAALAAEIASGYSNLEYDLDGGGRGQRDAHVEPLLCALSGAEAAMAVNNNAAAVLLTLAATSAGREVIVSRGQLVEIGGSFRVPEILAQSDSTLVEVGTTNRTRLSDYEKAIGPKTVAILRVHQSNFRTVGFVEEAALADLCELARSRGFLVIDDLGSGAIEAIGDEPRLGDSIAAGADLVCASADKLFGGPQAGILVGRALVVDSCRTHPLARALRLDKLQLAALEATLRLHRDQGPSGIPALAMLGADEQELLARAEQLAALIGGRARVSQATSRPGGGSLPMIELEGPVCLLGPGGDGADALVARLRQADPPVVARIVHGEVVLDPRTVFSDELDVAARAVRGCLENDG